MIQWNMVGQSLWCRFVKQCLISFQSISIRNEALLYPYYRLYVSMCHVARPLVSPRCRAYTMLTYCTLEGACAACAACAAGQVYELQYEGFTIQHPVPARRWVFLGACSNCALECRVNSMRLANKLFVCIPDGRSKQVKESLKVHQFSCKKRPSSAIHARCIYNSNHLLPNI